jgi:uncharacterized small protein (DUF1192 family)
MSEVEQPQGFDLMVTHRDPKTGLITKQDPYTLIVGSGENGGKTRMWERPKGSGNLWNKRGEPIGRFVAKGDGKREYDAKAKHVEFIPPETEDQQLARSLTEKSERIAQLEKELAGIKAEKDKKGKGA